MYEQDYIMRMIKEMIRFILKVLFKIDVEEPTVELLQNKEGQKGLEKLLDMIDDGNINEAENQIYELTEQTNMQSLEMALLFYSYLNEKGDDFLEQHDFSRREIKEGLQRLVALYGLSDIAGVYLMDM